MADLAEGTINILKSDIERYPELKEAVWHTFYEGFGDEYNPDFDIRKERPLNIDNWSDSDSIAYFCDYEARYGCFEKVQNLCRKFRVPYDRWADSCGEYDKELVFYRPGVYEDQEIYQNEGCGDFVVPLTKLKELCKDASDADIATGLKEILKTFPEVRPLEDYEHQE